MWKQYEKQYALRHRIEKFGWEHPAFDSISKELKEEEEFIENPFEVKEGIMDCIKCGSKKTFAYQKQVRSADEGFTLFVSCLKCNHSWREN